MQVVPVLHAAIQRVPATAMCNNNHHGMPQAEKTHLILHLPNEVATEATGRQPIMIPYAPG
jgi:hypothetical protein